MCAECAGRVRSAACQPLCCCVARDRGARALLLLSAVLSCTHSAALLAGDAWARASGNHGVEAQLLQDFMTAAEDMFALPQEVKHKFMRSYGARGGNAAGMDPSCRRLFPAACVVGSTARCCAVWWSQIHRAHPCHLMSHTRCGDAATRVSGQRGEFSRLL